ncbi:MAG: indolepyruvate oxidoreductase subunit beta [Chloroflexi bacterium]|nr:indolepyruvate oxidoreductase subunit beta [Chloroflexota bacterium]
MKYDVILAGVGGQGVLSIATILAVAAVDADLRLRQAEVHGMSQRGGEVQSHLRIADRPIYSDLIPVGGADLLLSMEPMEALRYVSFLKPDGVIVTERTPLININNYPEIDRVIAALEQFPRVVLVDAEGVAREMRATRSSNMVLLGAASAFVPLPGADLEAAIGKVFGRKGESMVAQNVEAFRRGRAIAEGAHAG